MDEMLDLMDIWGDELANLTEIVVRIGDVHGAKELAGELRTAASVISHAMETSEEMIRNLDERLKKVETYLDPSPPIAVAVDQPPGG